MKLQSKDLSLKALGIENEEESPGMIPGVHLRVAPSASSGFPRSGFRIYRRWHHQGIRHILDIAGMVRLGSPISELNGIRDQGKVLYHTDSPRPTLNATNNLDLNQKPLGLRFRPYFNSTDSHPKVWKIKMSILSRGRVEAIGYDDRWDPVREAEDKTKIPVARTSAGRSFIIPDIFSNIFISLYGLFSIDLPRIFIRIFNPNRANLPHPDELQPNDVLKEIQKNPPKGNIFRKVNSVLKKFNDIHFEKDFKSKASHEESFMGPDFKVPDMKEMKDIPKEMFKEAVPAEDGETAHFNYMMFPIIFLRNLFIVPILHLIDLLRPGNTIYQLELRADLISLVEITGAAGSKLLSLEYYEIDEDALGWTSISTNQDEEYWNARPTPLFLPITNDEGRYPTAPDFLADPNGLLDFARNRLKHGFIAGRDTYLDYEREADLLNVKLGRGGEAFTELKQVFHDILLNPRLVRHFRDDEAVGGDDAAELAMEMELMALILTASLDSHFAKLVGLLIIDFRLKRNDHYDYKVEAEYDGVTHAWITHDVYLSRDQRLTPPREPDLNAVSSPWTSGDIKTKVHLDWNPPTPLEQIDRDRQYIYYHIYRQNMDGDHQQERLTEGLNEEENIVVPDPFFLTEKVPDENAPPDDNPFSQGRMSDKPPEYGTYRYGLQAVDIFGRKSEITLTDNIAVENMTAPPPVTELFAHYLDTSHPHWEDLSTGVPREIIEAVEAPAYRGQALLISFTYPASHYEIDPDIQQFSLHFRQGVINQFPGILESSEIIGPRPGSAVAEVRAEVILSALTGPWNNALNAFAADRSRGYLQASGEQFVIHNVRARDPQTLIVEVKARRDFLPQTGQAVIIIAAHHPRHVAPNSEGPWHGFDVHLPPRNVNAAPLDIQASDGRQIGALVPELQPHHILTHMRRIPVPARDPDSPEPPGVILPEDAVDRKYYVMIQNFELPLPDGHEKFFASVNAQGLNNRGLKSIFPQPATVERQRYGAPEPINTLSDVEFEFALKPDFNQQIAVHLRWRKIPGIQKFRVYRCSLTHLLGKLSWNQNLYADLENDNDRRREIKLQAGLKNNIDHYTVITPVPVSPPTDSRDPQQYLWVDRFAAPEIEHYFYRIQPVGLDGTPAPWPEDSDDPEINISRNILVLQRKRDKLPAPFIYELRPSNRYVSIIFKKPLTPNIAGLRMYKTDDINKTRTVRKMTLLGGTIPLDHRRLEELPQEGQVPARLVFEDRDVKVGQQYYYRFIAVDHLGTYSTPTEPMAVSPLSYTPPAPPLLEGVLNGNIARLSWSADHEEGQVKVQRKAAIDPVWADIPAGAGAYEWYNPTDRYDDDTRLEDTLYGYRLLLRDPRGNIVYSGIITL